MVDFALNKKVLEFCNHAGFLTDGLPDKYDGKTGYLGIHTPSYVTVDLLAVNDVKHICFKLWDNEDPDNICQDKQQRVNQLYSYRLLISSDKKEWKIVYDCSDLPSEEKYKKGWQSFEWANPVQVRYIRIHCMNGKRNSGFHIVELHAYDQVVNLKNVNTPISFPVDQTFEVEIGDAYPLSYQLSDFSGRFQDTLEARVSDNKDAKAIYDSIVDFLFRKAKEVDSVNGKVDEIRRLVADPVKDGIQSRFKEENLETRRNIRFSVLQLFVWLLLLIFSFYLHV